MAAGPVDIPALDGAGAPITLRMWSTTGLASGVLSPLTLTADPSYNLVDPTSTVNVAKDTAMVKNGSAALVPKFLKLDFTATGDLLALVAGKRIRVIDIFFTVSADMTLQFGSGGTTTLTGAMTFKAGGGVAPGLSEIGHFQTVSGEKLNVIQVGAGTVAGGLVYVEV